MAQLPVSMRRKRAAITSIHDKPPTRKEKLSNFGGWLLLCIAVLVLAFGILGLYKVMTNTEVAELGVLGTRSAAEQRQVLHRPCNWYRSNRERWNLPAPCPQDLPPVR